MNPLRFLGVVLCAGALAGVSASSQSGAPAGVDRSFRLPQPLPMPPPIPAARDIPYPGTIRLAVDATDIDRRLFRVTESIPVRGGEPVVLLFPKWIPGHHTPNGRVDKLAGLIIRANGRRLEW